MESKLKNAIQECINFITRVYKLGLTDPFRFPVFLKAIDNEN